jgi:hypothetical protein
VHDLLADAAAARELASATDDFQREGLVRVTRAIRDLLRVSMAATARITSVDRVGASHESSLTRRLPMT